MRPRLGPGAALTLPLLIALAACPSAEEERPDIRDAAEAQGAAVDESREDPSEMESESMAADAATSEPATESGVEGLVTLGPRCPTVEVGQDCPDRPYSVRLVVRRADSGDVVATLSSGDDGSFRLPLDPGDYILEPESAQLVHEPRAQPLPFTVRPGEYTQLEMRFDSGVR